MNWADYFNADIDAVVFGYTDILLFGFLNPESPLQLYFLFIGCFFHLINSIHRISGIKQEIT